MQIPGLLVILLGLVLVGLGILFDAELRKKYNMPEPEAFLIAGGAVTVFGILGSMQSRAYKEGNVLRWFILGDLMDFILRLFR